MDSGFSFVVAFVYRATRCAMKAPVMVVHLKYSAVIILIMNRKNSNRLQAAELTSIKDEVAEL